MSGIICTLDYALALVLYHTALGEFTVQQSAEIASSQSANANNLFTLSPVASLRHLGSLCWDSRIQNIQRVHCHLY